MEVLTRATDSERKKSHPWDRGLAQQVPLGRQGVHLPQPKNQVESKETSVEEVTGTTKIKETLQTCREKKIQTATLLCPYPGTLARAHHVAGERV